MDFVDWWGLEHIKGHNNADAAARQRRDGGIPWNATADQVMTKATAGRVNADATADQVQVIAKTTIVNKAADVTADQVTVNRIINETANTTAD
jgi:hypothetical protein